MALARRRPASCRRAGRKGAIATPIARRTFAREERRGMAAAILRSSLRKTMYGGFCRISGPRGLLDLAIENRPYATATHYR
jgi:hypothetical protein